MVYIYLADGFEEVEVLFPLDLFKRQGVKVRSVSISENFFVTSSRGISVKTDLTVKSKDYAPELAELIILPGGALGTDRLDASPEVHYALDYAYENGKYVAAFSGSASVLDKKGFLNCRTEDSFSSAENLPCKENVCDEKRGDNGKFITVSGAEAITDFVLEMGKRIRLANKEKLKEDVETYIRDREVPCPVYREKSNYEYICEAMKCIFEMGRVSTGSVQRYLHVGFNKAADVVDMLEEKGFVSPRDEVTHQRKILIDYKEFERWKQQNVKFG